jgi:hypothetical protein
MSSTLSNPSPPPDRPLAELSLEHVGRELAQLEAALAALQEVRTALLGKDPSALGAALARHQATADRAQETCRLRAEFQREVSARLGIAPDSVTLELLIARLPDEAAGRLGAARARLRRIAAEIEQLNSTNASLLYYCLDFFRRFFARVAGHGPHGLYGPTGALAASAGNPSSTPEDNRHVGILDRPVRPSGQPAAVEDCRPEHRQRRHARLPPPGRQPRRA